LGLPGEGFREEEGRVGIENSGHLDQKDEKSYPAVTQGSNSVNMALKQHCYSVETDLKWR